VSPDSQGLDPQQAVLRMMYQGPFGKDRTLVEESKKISSQSCEHDIILCLLIREVGFSPLAGMGFGVEYDVVRSEAARACHEPTPPTG